jgi:hypothetical protein
MSAPVVRAIAAGRIDPFALAADAIQFAASRAFEQGSNDADAFWDALEARPAAPDEEEQPAGMRWSGRFGGADDRAQIPQRLPRLHALFAERASAER